MNHSIYDIPVPALGIAVGLVLIVGLIYWRWSLQTRTILYATIRMIIQLVAIGFVLIVILRQKNPYIITSLLIFMCLVASWIALRPMGNQRRALYPKALLALGIGGTVSLALVIGGVIRLTPWYEPRYLIPIASMIYANAMNGLSLAAERFRAECAQGQNYRQARGAALQTALLPITNSFLASGLVALPGMMTGQILAGISPLVAVRYQIMVMSMVFGATGISAAIYLALMKKAR